MAPAFSRSGRHHMRRCTPKTIHTVLQAHLRKTFLVTVEVKLVVGGAWNRSALGRINACISQQQRVPPTASSKYCAALWRNASSRQRTIWNVGDPFLLPMRHGTIPTLAVICDGRVYPGYAGFQDRCLQPLGHCPALARNRDPKLLQSRQIIASRARCKDAALAQRCTGARNRSTSASAAMVPNAPHWPPATIRRQSAIPSALRSLYQCQLATP